MLEIIIMSVKNMLITVGGTSASLKNLNVQLKTERNQEKKFPFHINKKGKKHTKKRWKTPSLYYIFSHFFTSSWNISSNKLSFSSHNNIVCFPFA